MDWSCGPSHWLAQTRNTTSGYLFENKDRWLMIPREQFSNSPYDCGLIGLSFTAFKYQPQE